MKMIRLLISICAIGGILMGAASAAEQINSYNVAIVVEKDGDLLITETIDVTSEGNLIRRGIFRDLPRLYKDDGAELPYQYDIKRIRRDGRKEKYNVSSVGNAVRWRIGDPDVFLDNGRHVYEIAYSVKNQIRYFNERDELYWNAIGQYWAFPIERARVEVLFPDGANPFDINVYTGGFGTTGRDTRYRREGDTHVFETTRPLSEREGVTLSLNVDKGVIDPPSLGDRLGKWWTINSAIVVLIVGAIGISGFHYNAWRKVGVDPPKGPVFPQYEPPAGVSPAGVHYIYYRHLNNHDALIASLVNLGVNKWIKIDPVDKKKTVLTRIDEADADLSVFPAERLFLRELLSRGSSRTIGGETDTTFTKAYRSFQSNIARRFGSEYFKWNFGYIALAVALSVAAVGLSAALAVTWTIWHFIGVASLVVVNAIFAYLLPAPTEKGQTTRTAIEGFKLYLEQAEKLHLNAAEVGAGPPPVLTVERYERFLPYAIALGVEKPWTKHFEKTLPREASAYDPYWSSGAMHGYNSLHRMNSALVSSMSSGVSSALPQSSSSSGSGGGGFSGGGGGGGGGGGW